jgi:hypothetical protein
MIPFQMNSDADHGLSPGSPILPPLSPPEEPLLAPIWQWPPNWQCPMLGTGLGIGEQRRIFKRPQKTRRMDAYSLHQALMTIVGDENQISRRIDRLLRRKYQRMIAETAPLPPDEFFERWRREWQGPEGLGLFYVAAARRDLSEEMRREIYGCVHMAGHTTAGELLAARQEAERHRQTNLRLARALRRFREKAQERKKHRQRQPVIPRYTRPPIPATARAGHASPPMPAPGTGTGHLQAEVHRLEREKRRLEIRYFEIQSQNAQLAEEVRGLMTQLAALLTCRGRCRRDDLPHETPASICPRRILIVGGMTKLHHLYRELVAAAGGELDYHDGYLRQGNDNLQARIGRSDLVICPVNCNSHNACKRVKGICKRLKKPLHILPSASLSAISAALHGSDALSDATLPSGRENTAN